MTDDAPLRDGRAHHRDRQWAPVMVDVASADGDAYSVTPMGGHAWPAGATVVITLDAATTEPARPDDRPRPRP